MATTFLFHFGEFQPLWKFHNFFQIGPRVKNGPASIHIPDNKIQSVKNQILRRGISNKGVLLHYTDPFIMRSLPLKGVKEWQGPKLLVCGDLHHGVDPIGTLKTYFESEPHDAVLLTFNPKKVEEVESELKVPVRSLPPTFFRYAESKPQDPRIEKLLHVGSLGPHHSRRKQIVDVLIKRSEIPFIHTTTSNPFETAYLYSKYLAVLNIPLNQDLNHRVFEIMAAGVPQIIFGDRSLQGNTKVLENRPDIFWASTVEEVEQITKKLIANSEITKKIFVESPPYVELPRLLKKAFMPKQ